MTAWALPVLGLGPWALTEHGRPSRTVSMPVVDHPSVAVSVFSDFAADPTVRSGLGFSSTRTYLSDSPSCVSQLHQSYSRSYPPFASSEPCLDVAAAALLRRDASPDFVLDPKDYDVIFLGERESEPESESNPSLVLQRWIILLAGTPAFPGASRRPRAISRQTATPRRRLTMLSEPLRPAERRVAREPT